MKKKMSSKKAVKSTGGKIKVASRGNSNVRGSGKVGPGKAKASAVKGKPKGLEKVIF